MARYVASPGASFSALEIRLILEGKSLDGQVQAMLDPIKIKLSMMGQVYDEDV